MFRLPEALRAKGLLGRLGAGDRGAVPAPAYDGRWDGVHVRNEAGIAAYTPALASRVSEALDVGERPLILGGDCSVLLGPALTLRRRGRHGLIFVDGHSDFRHPDNTDSVRSAAGEDLALATGRGAAALTDLDGLRPYFDVRDVILVGVRDRDAHLDELRDLGAVVIAADALAADGPVAAARQALARLLDRELKGFWLHVDADVVAPTYLPAVDTPEPGGTTPVALEILIATLAASPAMLGLDVTILDPDLDDDGTQVGVLTDVLAAGLGPAT